MLGRVNDGVHVFGSFSNGGQEDTSRPVVFGVQLRGALVRSPRFVRRGQRVVALSLRAAGTWVQMRKKFLG